MDSVNIILSALGSALAAGGQAAISDTVKDALESLTKHIRQAFSGRQNAMMILDHYEQDPNTWEKPLKDVLIKAGFSQDMVAIAMARRLLHLVESQQKMRDHLSIQHVGTGYGSVYGTNYGVINNTLSKDKAAEGMAALKSGQDALWRREYDAATLHLENAFRTLPETQHPVEGAQGRFLLALALLHGKRPRCAANQTFRRTGELLQAAIELHSTCSYLYTLAIIKRDYAWNGYPYLSEEADELIRQGRQIRASPQDQENTNLLFHCQPRLMQDAREWWG